MKNISVILIILVSLGFSVNSFAGQDAMNCLNVYIDKDNTYFENLCNQEITVAWCSTDKPVNGKLCGQQGADWNPYYTQMFALDPGEKRYKWRAGNIAYAACLGFINGWASKGKFSSDRRGNFGCHN